jgi:hypothetical protein
LDKLLDKLKTKNFSFSGSSFTEKKAIANGFLLLPGKELQSRISNKTVFGDYPMGYKFVTNIYENKIAKGVNNVGSTDYGNWEINFETHTLQLKWQNSWKDTLTRAYDVNGNIEFYDVDTGNWRTTFKIIENLKEVYRHVNN